MENKDLLKKLESIRVHTGLDLKGENKYGSWLIHNDNSVEFVPRCYCIDVNRLTQRDWISHLMEKGWMEGHLEDFMRAYWEAMRRQGIGQIIQSVY